MCMFPLYMYGYPYSSYMYGFSYLSVGVLATIMLITLGQLLYNKEKINKVLVITLISITGMLLIFSYSLFVPGVFAAICIYTFIKDFKEEGKTFLKIFKKNTLIVTGILLLVTILGIAYLVVPTFYIASQSNLKDALLNDGGMYKELYKNFIFYIPFGILYLVDKFKNRKEIKDLFQTYNNVKAVFTGHQHWTKKLTENNVSYYILGSMVESINENGTCDGVYYVVELEPDFICQEHHISL